ncbi:hypothetical protein J4437_00900 [Candidatus Woesearchaeota archaeon]|nr:hypothetical protein [Candidatus Woesearchaeota archaeon]
MAIKQLLGIENSSLTDMEIMEKLEEAQRRGWRVLELPINNGSSLKKKIYLSGIEEKGVMKDNGYAYYG